MNKNQVIGGVVALAVVAGGAFYAGNAYAKAHSGTGRANEQFGTGSMMGGNFTGRTGGRGMMGGGGFTAGEIISTANGSISIKEQNGSSTEIVLISPSTQILKTIAGAAGDLTTGTNVVVTGTANSDGSLTATSVQIRPAGMNYPVMRTNTAPASVQ